MTAERSAALHRLVWRWHFWAGLIVAPFLLILSATGAIYLFGDELNDAIHPELRFVAAHDRSVAPSRMIRAALAAYPGAASRIDLPAAADRPAVVFVARGGATTQVSVDPADARVLGGVDPARTLVGVAEALHGSLMIGPVGDAIVELAACWALVMLVTGVILWWPRGRWRADTLWPRWSARGRRWWRGLHGPLGLWAAALIGFLVVTGLPWAGVSGALLQRASGAAGWGYPASYRTNGAPDSPSMKATLGVAPWTLERAPMPTSEHAGHDMAGSGGDAAAVAGVDRVAALLARRGLTGGYQLFLPEGPRGVYTAFTYPDQPQGQRTIYVDRGSFEAVGPEVRYADYGWVGRAVELGVQLHMGNYFGLANQLVMLSACVAIWGLVISGVAMWWTRRPAGRLGAPPPPLGRVRAGGLLAVLLVAALLLPLFGASLIIVAAVDRLVRRAGTGSGRAGATAGSSGAAA